MRRALAVFAVGLAALLLQSALATLLPLQGVPDLGLLMVVAAALVLGPAEGLLVCAGLGLGADMLSGSLLGQQATLRLFEFVATRSLASQLDLVRPLPLAVYAAGLSLVDALGMAGLTRLFLGGFPVTPRDAALLAARSAVNGLVAPGVAGAVRRLARRLAEEEARREMRLETRRPVL